MYFATPLTFCGKDMGDPEAEKILGNTQNGRWPSLPSQNAVSGGSFRIVFPRPDHACGLHSAGSAWPQDQFSQPLRNNNKQCDAASSLRRWACHFARWYWRPSGAHWLSSRPSPPFGSRVCSKASRILTSLQPTSRPANQLSSFSSETAPRALHNSIVLISHSRLPHTNHPNTFLRFRCQFPIVWQLMWSHGGYCRRRSKPRVYSMRHSLDHTRAFDTRAYCIPLFY